MNYDIFLEFFYKQIINQNLIEELSIKKILKNDIVNSKEIIIQSLNCEFYICKFKLENKKILLIEDMPISFLLGHTILIGERAKIYEVEFEEDSQTYICDSELLEKIYQNQIESLKIISKKEIKQRELYNKKYRVDFKQPQIITELKEYLSNIKKIDFNKIHISNSNRVEMFNPTLRHRHFRLAIKMNLPIISLIKDNFIFDTTINIYDNNKLKEIINPYKTYKQKENIELDKKTNLRLYNDVDYELALNFEKDKEKIIEKINNSITNFDKDKIIKFIKSKNSIKISSRKGNIPLPIWKDVQNRNLIQIKNTDDFTDLTGIKFSLDKNIFEKLYIQTNRGEKGKYVNLYITKKYEKVFEDLNKEDIIEFENFEELIIQILYKEDIDIKNIIIKENISDNRVYSLRKKIKKMIKSLVLKSINENHYPQFCEPISYSQKYLSNINQRLENYYLEYEKNLSKLKLINNIESKIDFILSYIKYMNLKEEDMYFVYSFIKKSIKLLEIFDKENANELDKVLESYLKEEINTKEKNNFNELNFEKNFEEILILKKISKKKKVKIIKKVNIEELKEFETLHEPENSTIYIKPDVLKLKKIFKYNSNEIIERIKKIDYYDIDDNNYININNKKVQLKENFYKLFKKYKGYKTVIENDWFIALVKE